MLAVTVRRPAADGRPDPLGPRQWAAAAVIGVALLLGGNGMVSIAERRVASGPSAVIIATVPIWATLIAASLGREPVRARQAIGLALGFAGVAVLVVGSGGGRLDAVGVGELVVAALLRRSSPAPASYCSCPGRAPRGPRRRSTYRRRCRRSRVDDDPCAADRPLRAHHGRRGHAQRHRRPPMRVRGVRPVVARPSPLRRRRRCGTAAGAAPGPAVRRRCAGLPRLARRRRRRDL